MLKYLAIQSQLEATVYMHLCIKTCMINMQDFSVLFLYEKEFYPFSNSILQWDINKLIYYA